MNNRVRFQSATTCADTFEIVSYKDSIKTIDITPLCYLLRLKPYKDCRLWIVTDVCGGICVISTYSFIIFAECVACFVLFCDFWDSVHTAVNAAVFQCCTMLTVCSHVVCMFTDPVCIFSWYFYFCFRQLVRNLQLRIWGKKKKWSPGFSSTTGKGFPLALKIPEKF